MTARNTPGPHRLFEAAQLDCDVVVIGSGAGGATAALHLVRRGLDVLMLEEGPFVPFEAAPASVTESFATLWRCGGLSAAMGSPPVAFAVGRCVGGSTEINAAIMQRCPDELLAEWAERYQLADFGPESMAADYAAVSPIVNPSPTTAPHGAPTERFRHGADILQWRNVEVERAQRDCVGTNHCSVGCPTGGKQNMSTTAIRSALAAGLRLIADCRVTQIGVRGGRATGVDALATDALGRSHRVRVRARAVFVCAGAIHTPALLRRSGVRRNVGNSLRLHPSMKVLARFDTPLDAANTRLPLRAVTQFLPDQRLGGSMFLPGTFGMALAEDPATRASLATQWRNCGLYYAMVRAEGVGRIRNLPGAREPLVTYRMTATDLQRMQQAYSRLVDLAFAAGAVELHGAVAGDSPASSRADAQRWFAAALPAARAQLFTIHVFSSCPPGEDLQRCATDSFGAVHGVQNLIVADASSIPEAPGVNPQLTVMAMAHRAARHFAESPR